MKVVLVLTFVYYFLTPFCKCLNSYSCNERVNDDSFYFINPSYPKSEGNISLDCPLTLDLHPSSSNCSLTQDEEESRICQVRLNFDEFSTQPPLLGDCVFDQFYSLDTLLCGLNSGHHLYLNTESVNQLDFHFRLSNLEPKLYSCLDKFNLTNTLDNGTTLNRSRNKLRVKVEKLEELKKFEPSKRRAWKIKVTKIPCSCTSEEQRIPSGCLSFYTSNSGDIKSFNYDHLGCFSDDRLCSKININDCTFWAGYTGHLNNMKHSICIQPESGHCGIEYSSMEEETGSFSLTNQTVIGTNDGSGAENGIRNCVADYIEIPNGMCLGENGNTISSDRFCGNSLGFQSRKENIISYTRPFYLRFITDFDEVSNSWDYMNRGFHLKYEQIACNDHRHNINK
ncbi:uncharacterized protein [Lepeophtheirus salmonis]|uniref:uncharacterized protein n=1 Tax=Lepeophtheirus salmonis TaxID=72036 RepID=UPI001AE543DF|nr:uncharacterized protein LOC121129855 [Lepeophtheirus salmonis]